MILAAVVAGAVAIEAGSRVYAGLFLTPTAAAAFVPPPYEDAAYFSGAFVAEQRQVALMPGATGSHVILQDIRGRYINIVGGLRATAHQPASADRQLLVFGGSTIFSEEVPDDHTIPSYLQALINMRCASRVRVLNYGVPSMNALQQVSRLRETSIRPGDIVMFYDGVNDVYYTVYAGQSRRTSMSAAPDPPGPLLSALFRASEVSAAARVVSAVTAHAVPAAMKDDDERRRNLDRVEAEHVEAISEAHRYVQAAQGVFVHVLQPHLFATPATTPYRRQLVANYVPVTTATFFQRDRPERFEGQALLPVARGLAAAFDEGYPRLRRAAAVARAAGIESIDRSGILSADAVRGEVFLDFTHVNHEGNRVVAAALFDAVHAHLGECGEGG